MYENKSGRELVFGLDIGTRNVVGIVGYKEEDNFYVVAHSAREHETRAMLSGQIHDIGKVGKTIRALKKELEEKLEQPLKDVCIAAAGRVLKTVEVYVEQKFAEETLIENEHICTLDLLGVEEAQKRMNEENDTDLKFYCVGYSVVRYYIDGEQISNLEGHKANQIAEDVIVTFLPENVVDGLYSAVAMADLEVANLTLEPIAAINIAIPENFRLLNLALVDVGAGTSDICITKDGSIVAYGMIPHAGDEITEVIAQKYLVDFKTADEIKVASTTCDRITYKDILMIEHEVAASEIWELVEPLVDRIAAEVANKIIELNGNKSVSATFVVGGGGKIHGFTGKVAEKLGILNERVALRGEEVLQKVHFEQKEVEKDPLIVTPVGICLNYFDRRNNFIFVRFNGERVKLFDNNKLTVMDAALQAEFPNEKLFPRKGKEITYTLNGKTRVARGEVGEPAVIKVNNQVVSLSTPISSNAEIVIISSTQGTPASLTIGELEDYNKEDISFVVNGHNVTCPKFVEVNGVLQGASYEIQDGDRIEMRNYYTVEQLRQFMDVTLDPEKEILVNNKCESPDACVYENFSVHWTILETIEQQEEHSEEENTENHLEEARNPNQEEVDNSQQAEAQVLNNQPAHAEAYSVQMMVYVNERPITLKGKTSYVFVDVFDYINFDLRDSRGRNIVTNVNGVKASFTQTLNTGDRIEIYWKE